jgi:prepilin-type N-terminal cleavage/methylation domain-containing protein
MTRSGPTPRGFTLIELLIAMALAGLVLAAMSGLVSNVLGTEEVTTERNQLQRDARFAMQRMVSLSADSRRLLLPLADNPATNWPENIREETVPASPPIGSSTLATAVLAVTLPANIDLDSDGFPDADDDRDGLIDEDLPNDSHHDFYPGIMLIDDDGDGTVDDGAGWDEDDEDGQMNEDPVDGMDNDGDGSIDEDPASDNNGDACPGICGVDDNSDASIDVGSKDDDDEDGKTFDDPYDPVVFYLDGSTLMERMPVPWNEDGISTPDGPVDGRDFVASIIAENVTRFRVERVATAGGSAQLVAIELELTGPSGAVVSVEGRVRIGGAL